MGIFDRFFGPKQPPAEPPRSAHYRWVLERIAENESGPAARTQRGVQELLDALRSLRGSSSKGVFGMSTTSLAISDEEKRDLRERIGAGLIAYRDAFEKAGDVASLLELAKVADLCELPDLRLSKRFPLRCDPLGDPSGLTTEWQSLVERLRRAREGSAPLQWERAAEYFADDEAPKGVTFGEPNDTALYEFALRFEQAHEPEFSRELAAVWTVVDGIRVDDMWWYLSPVSEWSWEEEGLQVGGGQSVQGRLCLVTEGKSKNLADAKVVDLDDDGTVIQTYPSLRTLLDLLLP
jgi:hypothetical protein